MVVERPTVVDKKRHYWIYGRPNCGKTWRTQESLASASVFVVPITEFPFEDFNGEDFLLYDDHVPKFAELASLSNVYPPGWRVHVYGKSRYTPRHWPTREQRGGIRTAIVLSNVYPNYGELQAPFEARFNILQAHEVWPEILEE